VGRIGGVSFNGLEGQWQNAGQRGGAPRRATRAFLVAFQDVTLPDYPREFLTPGQTSKVHAKECRMLATEWKPRAVTLVSSEGSDRSVRPFAGLHLHDLQTLGRSLSILCRPLRFEHFPAFSSLSWFDLDLLKFPGFRESLTVSNIPVLRRVPLHLAYFSTLLVTS
jgi:hypothetical protein